jgi:hypothetical protein
LYQPAQTTRQLLPIISSSSTSFIVIDFHPVAAHRSSVQHLSWHQQSIICRQHIIQSIQVFFLSIFFFSFFDLALYSRQKFNLNLAGF